MTKYLSNYKIIKELGFGMFATVFLIYIPTNKKKYALKIQHIKKKDIKPNIKSNIWREINFSIDFANKYPEQFVSLYEYDFIDNCELEQKYPFDITRFSLKYQKEFKKISSSPYCIRKVYQLVDGDLNKLDGLLCTKQIYSLIIQLTFTIKLLHSNNYIHGDIHQGNVGWNKTNKNHKIKIANMEIPTFGYIFKLIDYGMVMKKSDIKNNKEKKEFEENFLNELVLLVHFMVDTKIYDFINDNKIQQNFMSDYNEFKKTIFYKQIRKYTHLKSIQMFLFDILFPDQYQKIIFGSKYSQTIPRKLYIPIDDIIYFIVNYKEPNKIIKLFNDKIL